MSKKFSDFIAAGYISGAHGIRGEIILVSQVNDFNLLDDTLDEGLVLGKDDSVVSFSVKSIRPHKGGYLILSEDIPDRNKAESLRGYSWLVPKEKMVSEKAENIFLHEIEGFVVTDLTLGELGKIVGFGSNGSQDLIEVLIKESRVSIPLVKAFIVNIDFEKRQVMMNLPPGLLDADQNK